MAVVTFPVPRQGWTGGSQPLASVEVRSLPVYGHFAHHITMWRYLQVMFHPLEATIPKSIDALYFEPSFPSV